MDGEQLTRRRVEIINEQRYPELGEVLAPDVVTHYGSQALHGLDELVGTLQGFAAFSDMRTTIKDLIVDGDRVGARYLTQGKHTGDFLGVPASGAQVAFGAAGVNRIAGGLIVESWTVDDFSALMRQIGALPAL
jgi:predicted ester cyclase